MRKRSQFRSPIQKPSQSISALKTSHFRPAHKNQVNFDPYTKTKSILTPVQKTSQFRSPPGVPWDLDSIHVTTPPSLDAPFFFRTPFFFVHDFCDNVTIVPKRHTLPSRQITLHHITPLVRHFIPGPGNVFFWWLVVLCMVVCSTGTQYLHVLLVQHSLTVQRPAQPGIP